MTFEPEPNPDPEPRTDPEPVTELPLPVWVSELKVLSGTGGGLEKELFLWKISLLVLGKSSIIISI